LGELLRPSSGIALLFVLYAYSGWNATTYLAEEVMNPQRAVGLSLVLGTLAVTFFYVLLNAVFLTSSPESELRGVLNVGSVSATRLLGIDGGRVMSGIIAFGLLASISAMVWAGPRVTLRVGQDYPLFGVLAAKRGEIPARAILLQLALVLGLIAFGSFENVLVFAQIPLLLCLMLGVIGLIVLRRKDQRENPRQSFTCPLYPLPPLIFILSALAGLGYSVFTKPWIALAGTGMMLLPLFLHRWISTKHHP
jgi:APA family basic amino acid/polyamine antiporter